MAIAIDNALSGLKVSQQALNLISQNIANANNADYTRQTINQVALNLGNDVGSGVDIASIDRQINDYISKSVVSSSSDVANVTAVNDYYNQLQIFIGQPGKSNSIDTYVNNFFNSMSQLSVNPETASFKTNALASGQTLANQVSTLAGNVETLRFNADTEIKQSTNKINTDLKNIFNLNVAVLNAKTNNQSINSFEDSIGASLKDLANEMNISYRTDQDGTVTVTTNSGLQLVGSGILNQLDYTPATSSDDFGNNIASSPIKIMQLDASGKEHDTGVALVSGGVGSQVTSTLTGGRIAGLLQIRDKSMPDVLAQLDNLTSQVVNSVNAVHNNGSGFPPLQTLTGTSLVDPTSSHQWGGSVMIAALNPDGSPVVSPYTSDAINGNGYAPLTLDLSRLNSGNGAGNPSFQAIIDKINQYYGPPQPRAHIGDLSNVQLVANSDSITAGSGTFNFSLNLSNLSANNSAFSITGAAITGGGSINTPAGSVTVSGGASKDTAGTIDFAVDMTAAGAGPYTVTLNVQTTNADGTTSNGVLTYTLTNAASGIRGNSYAAATASGSATLETPSGNNAILTAKLVDANGNEIAKNPSTGDYLASGYLQLSGANSSYRVALNELDSSEQGNTAFIPATGATNFGFSHYFGLNNFFTDTGQIAGSALNMSVSKSINNNPQLISMGQLALSTQSSDPTKPRYTYEIGSGSNQTAEALGSLSTSRISFASAGSLSETKLAFSDYAAQILGDASAKTASSASQVTQSQLINQGFVDKDKSIRGVNIDEEMANTILYQNAYSANARVITVSKQLFDDLLAVFQ